MLAEFNADIRKQHTFLTGPTDLRTAACNSVSPLVINMGNITSSSQPSKIQPTLFNRAGQAAAGKSFPDRNSTYT